MSPASSRRPALPAAPRHATSGARGASLGAAFWRDDMTGYLADWASVVTRWQTWMLMANQDLSMRYRRSILGPFWISIAMAVTVFAISVLFSEVQGQPFETFLAYFGLSLLAWTLLSGMINDAATLVTESEHHLRNLAMPIPLLAAKMVYRNFVAFLHNALVIVLMLVLYLNLPLGPVALLSLLALLVYLPLGLCLAIVLGPLCARFRDLPQVIASIVQVMFFLTPIFWAPKPNMSRPVIIEANPFYHLLEIFRRPMLGEPATAFNWIVALSCVMVMAVLALASLAIVRKRVFLWL
jgi:ABC-type polysaccharide/polyol phosphate export permease